MMDPTDPTISSTDDENFSPDKVSSQSRSVDQSTTTNVITRQRKRDINKRYYEKKYKNLSLEEQEQNRLRYRKNSKAYRDRRKMEKNLLNPSTVSQAHISLSERRREANKKYYNKIKLKKMQKSIHTSGLSITMCTEEEEEKRNSSKIGYLEKSKIDPLESQVKTKQLNRRISQQTSNEISTQVHSSTIAHQNISLRETSFWRILYDLQKCFICSEKYKIMISLQEHLNDEELSIGQMMQELNFITVSDALTSRRLICFVCIANIHCSYHLKIKCGLIEKSVISAEGNITKDQTFNTAQQITASNCLDIKLEIDIDDGILEIKKENVAKVNEDEEEIQIDIDVGMSKNIETEEASTTNFFDEILFCQDSSNSYENKSLEDQQCVSPVRGKCFKNKKILQQHSVLTHIADKRHVCNVCNKSFSRSNSLTRHMIVHTGEKPYVCDVCNTKFTQIGSLSEHIKHKHQTVENLYICDVCDKSFNRKNSLTRHMIIHTGEKPHVCDVCNKAFNQLSILTKHKFLHLGIKPYVCNVCDKAFTTASDLRIHKLIHSNEKSFVCDLCGKTFTRKSSLTKHQIIHTKEKL